MSAASKNEQGANSQVHPARARTHTHTHAGTDTATNTASDIKSWLWAFFLIFFYCAQLLKLQDNLKTAELTIKRASEESKALKDSLEVRP